MSTRQFRRTALSTRDKSQVAIPHLVEAAGKPPTVLALARHPGLANTTFRRRSPDVANELNQHRSQPSPHAPPPVSEFAQLKRDNAPLTRKRPRALPLRRRPRNGSLGCIRVLAVVHLLVRAGHSVH